MVTSEAVATTTNCKEEEDDEVEREKKISHGGILSYLTQRLHRRPDYYIQYTSAVFTLVVLPNFYHRF